MTIALSILGASGKMGKKILQLALGDPQFHIVGAGIRHGSSTEDLLNLPFSSDLLQLFEHCDVAIDFTSPLALGRHLEAAVEAKKALVIGTTGHTELSHQAIAKAAERIPILFSPNFSFGIALCLDAVSRLGRALYGNSTIDIIETHHTQKKDRPSGTALALSNAISQGKGVLEAQCAKPRDKEQIGIHSIRSEKAIGEHVVVFEWGDERIELKHTAHSRDVFAKGALLGAAFLTTQPPGLYSLRDLFRHLLH